MKKLLAVLALVAASIVPAHAQHHHRGPYFTPHSGYHRQFNNWFVPALIGGAVVYGVTRDSQPPVIVQQPPVIVQPPVVLDAPQQYGYSQNQRCTPWTEIQNPDGTITRQRQCY